MGASLTEPGWHIAEIGQARNIALRRARYPESVRVPRCESNDGIPNRLSRLERIGEWPVHFTPHDLVMVYCVQREDYEEQQARPWRILIGKDEALDKRGRVRRWGSQKSAMAEARRIERERMGIPKRRRVGIKAEPAPPGALLELMEADRG